MQIDAGVKSISFQVKIRVCPDDVDDSPQPAASDNELLFGELDPRFRAHRERTRRKLQQQGLFGAHVPQKRGALNLRGDSECDDNGQRSVCMTKYETKCSTKEIKFETVEDHPNCHVEMTDKCDESPDKFGSCKRVGLY